MLKAPKRVVYPVADLENAKQWYRNILEVDPIVDFPMNVVFNLGQASLFLTPQASSSLGNSPIIVFWEVEDTNGARRKLLEAGATPVSEISTGFGKQWATVKDPFGNILGIISELKQSQMTIENRPSDTAQGVAFLRALATIDERQGIRGPDHLAKIFLNDDARKALQDPVTREWMKIKFLPPGAYEFLIARTACFDDLMETALQHDIAQIVFLGAGYDTRSYRFSGQIQNTRIYEVDAPSTQEHKRSLLKKAGIAIPVQLKFVPVNFNTEQWGSKLLNAGLQRNQKTMYIWEGVTYYLKESSINQTLQFIRENSRSGSTVNFDYLCRFPGMEKLVGVQEREKFHRMYSPGEPILFSIEKGTLGDFLEERGFHLTDHIDAKEMEKRYLTLKDCSLAGKILPTQCLARATVR